jgi:hypothetical protein
VHSFSEAFLSLGLLEVSQGEIGLIHLLTQLIQLVHQGPGKLIEVLTDYGLIHLITMLIKLVHHALESNWGSGDNDLIHLLPSSKNWFTRVLESNWGSGNNDLI